MFNTQNISTFIYKIVCKAMSINKAPVTLYIYLYFYLFNG